MSESKRATSVRDETDEDVVAAPAVAPAIPESPSAIDTLIEAHFVAGICNSIASRNTEIFNHIRTWVDDLKRHLKEI